MALLSYVVAYLGILTFGAVVASKCIGYLKKPVHLRWELYPVAHEDARRASYGGSYMEDSGWWLKKRRPSRRGGIKAVAVEFSTLHSTFRNNRPLWYRAYPFHLGLYLLTITMCLAVGVSVLASPGGLDGSAGRFVGRLGQTLALTAFLCILAGASGLLHRRLTVPDLKAFSTPEHFFNLGLFLGLSVLGLILWLAMPSFFGSLCLFLGALLTFGFISQGNALFDLFIIFLFALMAYVPATHMGHFFMKYFLWHDIRWDDQPARDNPETQRKISVALGRPVSWSGGHVEGGGARSWAEVVTGRPAMPQKREGATP